MTLRITEVYPTHGLTKTGNEKEEAMNENQKQFLEELFILMRKYSIDTVKIHQGRIVFMSNNQVLAFKEYKDDSFEECYVSVPSFTPNTRK